MAKGRVGGDSPGTEEWHSKGILAQVYDRIHPASFTGLWEPGLCMFFRSWKSLLLSKIAIIGGCVLIFFGFTYRDVATREVSTVGRITRVQCGGKGCGYAYVFVFNGVNVLDDREICKTPLTTRGCVDGALVRVYYDPDHLSESKLQDFVVASRENLISGASLVGFGLVLIALYFLIKRAEGGSDGSPDPDRNLDNAQPDVIHIVPGE